MRELEIARREVELQILEEKLSMGDKMYSMSDLVNMFSIGSSTANRLLKAMEKDGIIYLRRGRGYYIKPMARQIITDKYSQIIEEKARELKELAQRCEMYDIVEKII